MNSAELALFPLSQGLFPDSLLTLNIFEVRYLHLIRQCQERQTPFGVVPLAAGTEVQKPGQLERLHETGCLAELVEVSEIQTGLLRVTCMGGQRFRLGAHHRGAFGLWWGEITLLDHDPIAPIPAALQSIADQLGALIASAQQRGIADQLPMRPPYRLDESGWVANRWADLLPLPAEDKTSLLAEPDPVKRLQHISEWL